MRLEDINEMNAQIDKERANMLRGKGELDAQISNLSSEDRAKIKTEIAEMNSLVEMISSGNINKKIVDIIKAKYGG